MKKTILIFTILVVVILLAIGGYYLWQYFSSGPEENGGLKQSPGPSYSVSPNTSAQPAFIAEDQLVVWGNVELADFYVKNGTAIGVGLDGQVFSLRGKSKVSLNTAALKEPILKIVPSFDGKSFIEKWGSDVNPRFSLYNTGDNSWTTLSDAYFVDLDFSPTDLKIAYVEQSTGKANLGIMDLTKKNKDGSFARTIIDSFSIRDARISWNASDTIFISDKPSISSPGSVWRYTISSKRLDPLFLEQSGIWINWDKGGTYGVKFLHGASDKLEAINTKGETVFTSQFLSFPDKCALSKNYLYCAVPGSLPANSKLPDDYLKKAFYTYDYFYRFDIETGEEKLIFNMNPANILDVSNMKTENGNLYFINRYDNKLYQLSTESFGKKSN